MKPSARGLDQAAGRNTSDGYYDSRFLAQAIKILPGEFRATGQDLMLVTVLGSCVAACVHDPVALVGGMNHFMLPEGPDGSLGGDSARYGSYAMEVLINELFKLGARRERLEAKVAGGGAVLPGMTFNPVGDRNGRFAIDYLRAEGIRVVAQDLFDVFPRRVHFFPASGRMLVKRLPAVESNELVRREEQYRRRVDRRPAESSIELF